MNYAEFYKNAKLRMTDTLVSMWAQGHPAEQECLRELLDKEEPLIAEPVFQTIFPWEPAEETFEEHASKLHILDENFVQALANIGGDAEEYRFPADRHPYKHQSASWKGMLCDGKTIAVTTGTGSGKTECFIIPVLQDLYRQRCMHGDDDGVQAIFLYPLNALMKNQRERIHQWSKALPVPVRYAIYNGDMLESGKTSGEFPQVCTRKEMRAHPPQILFTNPTMLNYMMVRSEDQELLEKSKGKLRWILLDEAHTYSGSSATELALQLRRVIDAFGVTIDDVNFAVTSATMGGKDAEEKLKGVVAQLTGKKPSDILVVNGKRIIPEFDTSELRQRINTLNRKHGCHLTPESVKALRKRLNEAPALSAKEIASACGLGRDDMDARLSLIDDLGTPPDSEPSSNGVPLALLPTRAHFFIRAVSGVYACVNPECRHKNAKPTKLGSFTTYQSAKCPYCNGNMVEVASCADCGELLLVGENNATEGYRLRTNETSLEDNPFEIDSEELEEESGESDTHYDSRWKMFVCGAPQKSNPRKVAPLYIGFDTQNGKIVELTGKDANISGISKFQTLRDENTGFDLCPCCGVPIKNRLLYLHTSANHQGRILAGIVLDNASPISRDALANDPHILCEGKKYITFTDSRQGTAKSAMSINHDVERNWIRSAIYQNLAISRCDNANPQELSPDEQQEYDHYVNNETTLMPFQRKRFNELKTKLAGNRLPVAEPREWENIRDSLGATADLRHLYRHLKNARLNETSIQDSSNAESDAYLNALFLDQFGWIPKNSNSLENIGLVHIVYPPLANAQLPEELGAYKSDDGRAPFTDKDWRDYLKICVDYQIRGGKHYIIPDSSACFLVQNTFTKNIYDEVESSYKKGSKWPQLPQEGPLQPRQHKLILLLLAALGIKNLSELDNAKRTLINTVLRKAWSTIRDTLLEETDHALKGYRINLLDKKRVKLQIVEKGWKCPVDCVVVDTLFRGYSPRMRGYATSENFERYKVDSAPMDFPYFPYAGGKKKTADGKTSPATNEEINAWIDENWSVQKQVGIISNLHYRILSPFPIFLAGEHSAQQQTSVLENYEKEFNQGHLNILSCSTTMEMGVDLKGISAVVMNSVPPRPANYQQRAGRAGRRGETKALALTFCPPNPVGINAWRNPKWPLEHKTEIPDVKLTSPQIVQRHVNAFLFENFTRNDGGMGVKANICDFFAEQKSTYDKFCEFLQRLSNPHGDSQELEVHYMALVTGTCLGNQTIFESIDKCLRQMQTIRRIYGDRLEALREAQKLAEENGSKAAVKAILDKIKKFENTYLLGFLAEMNFLPSAGIPTGLVEFDNTCKEDKPKKKLPSQNLRQAISMYAPGKQVVINEWCYQSSGIALKSKFEESKRHIIQSCTKCHYTQIVYGKPLDVCPVCNKGNMVGLKGTGEEGESPKFTEVVEPAGFSVDWLGRAKQTRSLKPDVAMSFVQPLLLQMEPWPEKKSSAKVALRSSAEGSEILFYNNGSHQKGFMLCPYCGRMESESDSEAAKQQFINHKHLLTGTICDGAGHDGGRIRHNVLLVGRCQTDFVEVKFYDERDDEIKDAATLYSLGVVISRKLAEYLGVNDGEIDFGYNQQYNSIFIYDTAMGGAGYSPLLRDYKNEVFDLARAALREKCCSKACTHCLVDRSSQWYLNYLDRQKASDWLEMEYKGRSVPDDVRSAYPDAETITLDWTAEFYRVCRDNSIESLRIFIDGTLANWKYDEFEYKRQVDQLKAKSVDCRYVVANGLNIAGLNHINAAPLLRLLCGNNFECGRTGTRGLTPLLFATFRDGRKRFYFGKDISTNLDGNWGEGTVFAANLCDELTFNPVEIEPLLDKFNAAGEGMFDFKITESNVCVASLFDVFCRLKPDKWSEIQDVFAEDQNVEITYADKYLNTPLGCVILANLIHSIAKTWRLQIGKIHLSLAAIRGTNVYGHNEFDSDFAQESLRNDFLKTCLTELVGLCPDIEMVNNLHPRYLRIQGEKHICEIRPDAGIAWGWSLDRKHANLRLDDFKKDVKQNLALFNKRRNDGILYTVGWQKNA